MQLPNIGTAEVLIIAFICIGALVLAAGMVTAVVLLVRKKKS